MVSSVFYDYPCYTVLPRHFVVQLSKRTIRDSTDSLKAYVSIFSMINHYYGYGSTLRRIILDISAIPRHGRLQSELFFPDIHRDDGRFHNTKQPSQFVPLACLFPTVPGWASQGGQTNAGDRRDYAGSSYGAQKKLRSWKHSRLYGYFTEGADSSTRGGQHSLHVHRPAIALYFGRSVLW